MPSQSIPKDEWTQFFDEFSRRYEGGLVTVQLFRADFNVDRLAESVPLEGITAGVNGHQITISCKGARHVIDWPGGVRLFQREDGTDDVLTVYADAGSFQVQLLRSRTEASNGIPR